MLSGFRHATRENAKATTGGGVILVFLPSCAVFFGQDMLAKNYIVGLPTLAILGIMILFGALSLISTIFEQLGLANKDEALALPPGSIRAAISLSLIVLFALISIMLYQSVADPYEIPNLTIEQKNMMLSEPINRIMAVIPQKCPQPSCLQSLYTVHLVQPQNKDSTDLAKQLLILIGTLMTSVTSFYFGARTSATSPIAGVRTAQSEIETHPQPLDNDRRKTLGTQAPSIDEPNLPDSV